MSQIDYNDVLLNAIDTVIVSRIAELQFDRTIICTIVDDTRAKDGKYTVTNGAIEFEASSENQKYRKDDRVSVLIPSNDYSKEKTILSKISSDELDKPITYVSPLEKIVTMKTNYGANIEETGITANGKNLTQLLYRQIHIPENTINYDTLCVSADFKSLMNEYDMRQGSYGLMITLLLKDGTTHSFALDSLKDMFGNPYGFTSYFTQQQAYHLNFETEITAISVYLYQSGDFKFNDGINMGLQDLEPMEYDNIFVKNVKINFGYNAEQIADNTVRIGTTNVLSYDSGTENATKKTLALTWFNKDNNNKYLGFEDGQFDKVLASDLSRWTQEEVNDFEGETPPEVDSYRHPVPEGKNYYWIEWYIDDATGASIIGKEYNVDTGLEEALTFDCSCVPQLAETNVYAIVWLNKQKYKSNIITFTNITDKAHLVLGTDITISIDNDENAKDTYAIYGEDNMAIAGEAYKLRKVKFNWNWNLGHLSDDYWIGANITWSIPDSDTMIRADETELQTRTVEQVVDGDTIKTNLDAVGVFTYRLNASYLDTAKNNTISCRIEHNGFVLTATKSLAFSSIGNSGSDYTLVVRDYQNMDYRVDETELLINRYYAVLLDAEGNDISRDKLEISPLIPFSDSAEAYNVIKAVAKDVPWAGQNIDLQTLYPIIYSAGGQYYTTVPTKISYDSFGRLTTKIPSLTLIDRGTGKAVESCEWSISYRNKENRQISSSSLDTPSLTVPTMYVGTNSTYEVLIAKSGNKILYSQPLIFSQFKYGSEILNNWNGALILDETNNSILAAAAVFGKKEEDNTFSGVVLGDVKHIDIDNQHNTGMYGFKNGAQVYGFRDDGTAFIGGSGAGRIEFDGKKGVIQSEDFGVSNKSGSFWNLQNGTLILNGSTGEFFKFNENNSGKLQLKISGADIILADSESTLNGKISATANGLRTEFQNADAGLSSTITQTASSLRTDFQNADAQLSSTITQTASILRTEFKNADDGLSTSISQTASKIEAKADKNGFGNGFQWSLDANGFYAGPEGGNVLSVNKNGLVIQGDAEFSGTLKAAKGTFAGELQAATGTFIGGLKIGEHFEVNATTGELTCTKGTFSGDLSGSTISGATISGGQININNNFQVSSNGVMSCSGAIISGTLTAGAGSKLGNWIIHNGYLRATTQGNNSGTVFDLGVTGVFKTTGGTSQSYEQGSSWEKIIIAANEWQEHKTDIKAMLEWYENVK